MTVSFLTNWVHYLVAALFSVGLLGFLIRKNALVILMSIELMLNAVNLYVAKVSLALHSGAGLVLVVFAITVAAAEVAVGLAIILNLYRAKRSVDVDMFTGLKG
ncbi:MAG: NADH-quinone oxidoreductase subunit NuoK [Deltaproteobacteria bacterium]|nr:NADH-quinone oxidoreductase subunit NuoK [Deltaproteobacteria bacterium]MBI3295469.1 NADH-quinone oxidoreductase subunit NuoK [Deltaproteobacteria bacterium]